ncbi:multiprotein-bridging factor 1 family protein [Streptomyces albogriseolus]|uniref:helix-turn-helix domain-containing protein n=1 Tax=Streptomyces albogriseolus TaxID=1887 RepID=UPI00225A6728|nr:helix-turn-helix domain-containing protein [Streptomyces viridodiastaticus]MCX4622840.1 helix-turn-helix domain-containing protein [Streptomyces viridodiastaticus]
MTMTRDPRAWARLGGALRESREREGLTQAELAQRADVSVKSVQDAEAGKVPKSRMPYTLAPIAKALGWSAGSVDSVLAGEEPPAGWRTVRVDVEAEDSQVEAIIANAMVRATDSATGAEIRKAAKIALDELRRHGYLRETNGTQPNALS